MKKSLKLFKGTLQTQKFKGYRVYVAAKTIKEAAKLISIVCFDGRDDLFDSSFVKNHFNNNVWDDCMIGYESNEPCVYLVDNLKNKPFRAI